MKIDVIGGIYPSLQHSSTNYLITHIHSISAQEYKTMATDKTLGDNVVFLYVLVYLNWYDGN